MVIVEDPHGSFLASDKLHGHGAGSSSPGSHAAFFRALPPRREN